MARVWRSRLAFIRSRGSKPCHATVTKKIRFGKLSLFLIKKRLAAIESQRVNRHKWMISWVSVCRSRVSKDYSPADRCYVGCERDSCSRLSSESTCEEGAIAAKFRQSKHSSGFLFVVFYSALSKKQRLKLITVWFLRLTGVYDFT